MFEDHGTFIIGFSASKNHISISVETKTQELFINDIIACGYETTKMLFKIKQTQKVNLNLLGKLIDFNIEDKKDCTTFWRK